MILYSAEPSPLRSPELWPISELQVLDCRGFDSSSILILKCVILMSTGGFPEILSSPNLSRDSLSREMGRSYPWVHVLFNARLVPAKFRARGEWGPGGRHATFMICIIVRVSMKHSHDSFPQQLLQHDELADMPNLPTKIIPTKIC